MSDTREARLAAGASSRGGRSADARDRWPPYRSLSGSTSSSTRSPTAARTAARRSARGPIATPIEAGDDSLSVGRSNSVVRCPWHKWEFEIASGRCLVDDRLRVRRYAVRAEGDEIVVSLDQPVDGTITAPPVAAQRRDR